MISFVTDVNFQTPFISALRQRVPDVDVVRATDIGLDSVSDPELLEWAAQNKRVTLTHDIGSMRRCFGQRINLGLWSPGILQIPERSVIAPIVEDLEIIALEGRPEDFENTILLPPL